MSVSLVWLLWATLMTDPLPPDIAHNLGDVGISMVSNCSLDTLNVVSDPAPSSRPSMASLAVINALDVGTGVSSRSLPVLFTMVDSFVDLALVESGVNSSVPLHVNTALS